MAKNYLSIHPVAQFDPTACWAASLEWWARAVGNRTVVTQLNLLNLYNSLWDNRETLPNGDPNPNYGTVSRSNLLSIWGDSRWHLATEDVEGRAFTTAYINGKMRRGPCLIGYYEPAVSGNHVVVVYGASNTHVACMNPDGGRFQGRQVRVYSDSTRVLVAYPTV